MARMRGRIICTTLASVSPDIHSDKHHFLQCWWSISHYPYARNNFFRTVLAFCSVFVEIGCKAKLQRAPPNEINTKGALNKDAHPEIRDGACNSAFVLSEVGKI